MNTVPYAWNIPPALFAWLPPPLPVGLSSSERPGRTTLTKADHLFHSCVLQLATLSVFYFWPFICSGLHSSTEMFKFHEGKLLSILIPSLLSQYIK